MRISRSTGVFFLAVIVVLTFTSPVFAATSSEVEQELMCDCGCNDMLINCTCERAEELRVIIDKMLDEGSTKEEILGVFVSKFGETILSSPPRKGFNLVAYGAPAVGLIVGLGIAFVFVRRWTGQKDEDLPNTHHEPHIPSDEMDRKIDEELDRMGDS